MRAYNFKTFHNSTAELSCGKKSFLLLTNILVWIQRKRIVHLDIKYLQLWTFCYLPTSTFVTPIKLIQKFWKNWKIRKIQNLRKIGKGLWKFLKTSEFWVDLFKEKCKIKVLVPKLIDEMNTFTFTFTFTRIQGLASIYLANKGTIT